MPPMIRSDTLLFAIRSELDEQRYVRDVARAKPVPEPDLALAHHDGFIEGLEWALAQVEARATRAAA